MKLAERQTIRPERSNSAKLDSAWLKQLAMDCGADDVGLVEIDRLTADGRLDGYYLLHAARADLLRRAGRRREAATAYRRALAGTVNPAEVAYLERRLTEVMAEA